MQRNMEVKGMYIETIGGQTPISTAANTQTAASTVRPVTKADTENNVRVEAMDGESTQAQESASANASVSVNGSQNKDIRTPDEKKAAENEKIKKAIEKMNVQLPNSEIKFGIHEKTDRVMIKLLDKETKEVIKEFPPEKTLDMIAKCMEIAGVLMDEKL